MVSEEQKEYDKTITFTSLAKYMFGFMLAKIIRDSHKDDPLQRDIHELKKRGDQERAERLKAFWKWEGNKTPKNATEALNEIADEANFLLFQAGIIADWKRMKRE